MGAPPIMGVRFNRLHVPAARYYIVRRAIRYHGSAPRRGGTIRSRPRGKKTVRQRTNGKKKNSEKVSGTHNNGGVAYVVPTDRPTDWRPFVPRPPVGHRHLSAGPTVAAPLLLCATVTTAYVIGRAAVVYRRACACVPSAGRIPGTLVTAYTPAYTSFASRHTIIPPGLYAHREEVSEVPTAVAVGNLYGASAERIVLSVSRVASERARGNNCRARSNTMDRCRQWTLVVCPVIAGFVRSRDLSVRPDRPVPIPSAGHR